MTIKNDPIAEALRLPGGARFYRCALQVNPFEHIIRHNKRSQYDTEADYNNAIVQACLEKGIEVVAVADHYRVCSSRSLIECARKAGIHTFPGFEAVTKDGVHFLCLFDPRKDVDVLERILGDCGIHDQSATSPVGKYDTVELLEESRRWGAVCVAAHAAGTGGILATLSGQARMNAWQAKFLLACSLPGPVSAAPDHLRPILENKNAEYRREQPLAVINAQDICAPEDFDKQGAWCWIKMSQVSVEGLRQAFLDPNSRIRLAGDALPDDHTEFVALAWEGGFLDGAAIHFNENLNVLVGGRGTGKSTVIESLRYVLGLEPLGEDARRAHEGIVRNVLRSGTKITLLVRSHRPNKQEYRIERTIPNAPVIRVGNGDSLNLLPSAIVPHVQVFGQGELSELTKSQEKLTRLLARFVESDEALPQHKAEVRKQLEQSRAKILDSDRELLQLEERLAALPALEETLKRFQDAGLEGRLKEQSLLVREEQLFKTARGRLGPFREALEDLRRALPIDRAFVSQKALEGLPSKEILAEIETVLSALNRSLDAVGNDFQKALEAADRKLAAVRTKWEERKKEVQAAYEKILRELHKSQIDGEEFIRLRRRIEELRPLQERKTVLKRTRDEYEVRRRSLLAEWEEVKAEEFRQLRRAARKVTKKLAERVLVQVTFAGNREPLCELLREQVGGRLNETFYALCQVENLSLQELAAAWRAGKDVLNQKYKLPPAQADRLAQASSELVMKVEELDLPPTTQIKLNVAFEGQPAQWKLLEDLSTGQKATAVLLLLLLESDAPLVVDQPENDLDNRFITEGTEGIVPKMREEKRRRQFVFATHNANIPVLGDAELIVGLTASGEAGQEGKARLTREHMGSIDTQSVRELVEDVLEGGREAFEMRRLKYGF